MTRVLLVHNQYSSRQPSGENQVVERDAEQLRRDGVEVIPYFRSSDEISELPLRSRVLLPMRPTYSVEDASRLRREIESRRPDIVHIHNVYPLISPVVIKIAHQAGLPVVQTVHNYRHNCPSAIRYRDGALCDLCVGKRIPYPAVIHGCYRGSRSQSLALSSAAGIHRSIWRSVDLFLPVSEHVADSLRLFGIPKSRILVRPNSVEYDAEHQEAGSPLDVAFIGRLAPEKGIELLLTAWKDCQFSADRTLHIAGDGPLASAVIRAAEQDPSIVYHGLLDDSSVSSLIDLVGLVVVPSIWPEPDPLTAVRAQAHGRALIGTDRGALSTYVSESTGWICRPEVHHLSKCLTDALANRKELQRRGRSAREHFMKTRAQPVPLTAVYDAVLRDGLESLIAT